MTEQEIKIKKLEAEIELLREGRESQIRKYNKLEKILNDVIGAATQPRG